NQLLRRIAVSDAAGNDAYGNARALDARIAMMDGRVDRDSITPVHVTPRYEPTTHLLKHLFNLVQQRAAYRLVLHRGGGAQLLQQLALPLAEPGRGLHFHLNN